MSFPRYPAYKDSGVEWLGEVPEQWPVCSLSYRYEVALGKMLDEKRITGEHLAPYLRNVDVQWGHINTEDLPEMDFKGDDTEKYALKVGDLLVCEGGEVGRAAIWKGTIGECYYQKALHRLRPKSPASDTAEFLYYVLLAAASRGIFSESGGKSTIAHLTAEAFRRYRFVFPPLGEQAAIAAFLDRETAKLDALVAEYRSLIDLLKEKRQAVISHAVTKGLDPTVPMKDSGVEWLGEVPTHWSATRVKTLFRQSKRQGHPDRVVLSVYRDYGVVEKESRDDNYNKTPEDLSTYQLVKAGDLVINKMKAWQGSLGISPLEGITSPDSIVYASEHDENHLFIHYMLRQRNLIGAYKAISNGIRPQQWRLEPEKFERLDLVLPPREEQDRIVDFVNAQKMRLDSLAAEADQAISLLQERRTALVSAAVTGKIDVRSVVRQENAA